MSIFLLGIYDVIKYITDKKTHTQELEREYIIQTQRD